MEGQKRILFELRASSPNMQVHQTRQDRAFDERRKDMAEQRTGQIVIWAPNVGYTALRDLYFEDPAKTEQPCSQEDEPTEELQPEQLALSDIN